MVNIIQILINTNKNNISQITIKATKQRSKKYLQILIEK